ncbi:MAG: ATP-binding cassette domain-containing protein [Bacteroidota bacterium]|nr:ATP-binding cassette domain-containing protein [Bacteroidota bacterium]
MTASPLLQVNGLTVQLSGRPVLQELSFTIQPGEKLAVIGASGSGKTTLIKALAGQCFSSGTIRFQNGTTPRIAVIAQQHQFRNLSNLSSFYYQQRFNSNDSEDAQTVMEALEETGAVASAIAETLTLLGIGQISDTRLIQLSNGEHKRFQLAKALLQNAEWLLLDNPYTGLDITARQMLNTILDDLSQRGIQYLLVTSPSDVPASVTQVTELSGGKLGVMLSRQDHVLARPVIKPSFLPGDTFIASCKTIPPAYTYPDFSVAIRMVNTSVVYHGRTILDTINWEVKKGECWSVSGHNGSGKSTLLSLVNGDNPQAFANEIYLFDKRKGSGESIWDIKQRIGYVSPELHHYFDATATAFEVVASGLFDTIGLFRQLSQQQRSITNQWLALLDITALGQKSFRQLSNGQQRLVLLARALVKNPPLLILDEPCQGLDSDLSARFIALVDMICVEMQKTLIYVSHYKEEIPSCVTRSLELMQGRVAA